MARPVASRRRQLRRYRTIPTPRRADGAVPPTRRRRPRSATEGHHGLHRSSVDRLTPPSGHSTPTRVASLIGIAIAEADYKVRSTSAANLINELADAADERQLTLKAQGWLAYRGNPCSLPLRPFCSTSTERWSTPPLRSPAAGRHG